MPAGSQGDVSRLSSPAGLPVHWRPPEGLLTWRHVPGHAPGQVGPLRPCSCCAPACKAAATVKQQQLLSSSGLRAPCSGACMPLLAVVCLPPASWA